MRRVLVHIGVLVAAVGLGGPAAAVASGGEMHYVGTTSLAAINGFKDPVKFTLAPGGKTVRVFSFGTFGCLGGSGGFVPGTSPWSGGVIERIGSLRVSRDGSFSGRASSTHATKIPVYRDTISYRVLGHLRHGALAATGTIAVRETIVEPAVHRDASCGPVTMSFDAAR